MQHWSPHSKYRHVFAIVRHDIFADRLADSGDFAVTKVVWTQAEAEAEVTRLNKINADKGCRYSWQVTRLAIPSDRLRSAEIGSSGEEPDV